MILEVVNAEIYFCDKTNIYGRVFQSPTCKYILHEENVFRVDRHARGIKTNDAVSQQTPCSPRPAGGAVDQHDRGQSHFPLQKLMLRAWMPTGSGG